MPEFSDDKLPILGLGLGQGFEVRSVGHGTFSAS
jgi:hypothetical protein